MTIDNVCSLLARYYEGDATAEEVASLGEFFSHSEAVPDDLAVDAAIFRALAEAHEAEIAVPEGLRERIVAATVGSRSRRSRFLWLKPALAVAASLAVAITAGVGLLQIGSSAPSDASDMLATAADTVHTIVVAEIEPDKVSDVAMVAEAPVAKPAPVAEPAPRRRKAVKAAPGAPVAQYTREVTDPAEAAEVIQEVFAMLQRSREASEARLQACMESTGDAMAAVRDPLAKIKGE